MKSTGMVRKVDDLGRVVIPIEIRRGLKIDEKDGLEIFIEGDKVILRKYNPGCTLCLCVDQTKLHQINGHTVCIDCATGLARKVGII